MSEDKSKGCKETKPSRSTKSLLGTALKILLVLVAGGIIGALVYFSAVGWVPYLEQRLFEPVENNQAQLQEIAATQGSLQNQLTFLMEELQENQAINNQDLESAFAAAENRIDEIQGAIETANSLSLTQVPAQLATLGAQQSLNENHISALATAQMEYVRNGSEIELIKILALLSRANQYLLHANYGLAEDQLIAAQQILLEMDQTLVVWTQTQTLELTNAIEGAIDDLPDQPTLASGKLELAWQLALIGLQPLSGPEIQGTVSPTPTEAITQTPTPN